MSLKRFALAMMLLGCAPRAPRLSPPPERLEPAAPKASTEVPDSGVLTKDAPTDNSSEPFPETQGLYRKRLEFRHGGPTLSVRLMEGRDEITFTTRGQGRLTAQGPPPKIIELAAGTKWRVRILNATAAKVALKLLLAEAPYRSRDQLVSEQQSWQAKGIETHLRTIGAVYAVAGKVIDNRRYQLVTHSTLDTNSAEELRGRLLRQFGVRVSAVDELLQEPSGLLEISDADGNVVAISKNLATAESLQTSGFEIRNVEFNVGYDSHGFEDRSFRGGLQFTVDRRGKLAVINLVTLEELVQGVVPSEIFPRAHPEALKAQAVTARAEVLAKIGLRHLTDPYLLCSEQHCSVYKGVSGETTQTSAAVEATRGEGLFSSGGELVDAVYSAVCGGHTEDNDAVWGTPPDFNLRGRPDIIGSSPFSTPLDNLDAFLNPMIPAACRLSSWNQPGKFRWERRFSSAEMDALGSPLNLGSVRAITVSERGVSGRAKAVTLSGEEGASQLRGELNIRRFFKMLNSSLFVVQPERDAAGRPVTWVFHGGGWGHGVGMCQTGAIARAEAGQDYREILRHYYSGAEVAPIY